MPLVSSIITALKHAQSIEYHTDFQSEYLQVVQIRYCTELRYKVGPRLRELALMARGGQEARSRNLGLAL